MLLSCLTSLVCMESGRDALRPLLLLLLAPRARSGVRESPNPPGKTSRHRSAPWMLWYCFATWMVRAACLLLPAARCLRDLPVLLVCCSCLLRRSAPLCHYRRRTRTTALFVLAAFKSALFSCPCCFRSLLLLGHCTHDAQYFLWCWVSGAAGRCSILRLLFQKPCCLQGSELHHGDLHKLVQGKLGCLAIQLCDVPLFFFRLRTEVRQFFFCCTRASRRRCRFFSLSVMGTFFTAVFLELPASSSAAAATGFGLVSSAAAAPAAAAGADAMVRLPLKGWCGNANVVLARAERLRASRPWVAGARTTSRKRTAACAQPRTRTRLS